MPTLSVLILARNEAAHIADCIASVRFADEILVIDSGSTDDTVRIAAAAGARPTGFAELCLPPKSSAPIPRIR